MLGYREGKEKEHEKKTDCVVSQRNSNGGEIRPFDKRQWNYIHQRRDNIQAKNIDRYWKRRYIYTATRRPITAGVF